MTIIHASEPTPIAEPGVLTIGTFDGVHLGHQYLLRQLKAEAQRSGLKAMVVTFKEHPAATLAAGGTPRPLLTTLDDKLALLERQGIDYTALLDFTPQLAATSARDFMEHTLVRRLNGRALLIGYDNRFGNRRGETFSDYLRMGQELGLRVLQADELPADHHLRASSTAIRAALADGDVALAAQLLGRPYSVEGIVVRGDSIGRTIGFPTANLAPIAPNQILPRHAAYAVSVLAGSKRHAAMLYIGNRPTFRDLTQQRVEVHLLDFDGDLYGQHLRVEFIDLLRTEQHFATIDELRRQLERDLAAVRHICAPSSD